MSKYINDSTIRSIGSIVFVNVKASGQITSDNGKYGGRLRGMKHTSRREEGVKSIDPSLRSFVSMMYIQA